MVGVMLVLIVLGWWSGCIVVSGSIIRKYSVVELFRYVEWALLVSCKVTVVHGVVLLGLVGSSTMMVSTVI